MDTIKNTVRLLEEVHEQPDKPWGNVIGAALIVQMVTFSGLFIIATTTLLGRLRLKSSGHQSFLSALHSTIIPSFASGALLATAVLLIIPESLEMLGSGASAHLDHDETADGAAEHDHEHRLQETEDGAEHDHANVAWKFGACFLAGFVFNILLGAIFPSPAQFDAAESKIRYEKESLTGHASSPQDEEAGDGVVGSSKEGEEGGLTKAPPAASNTELAADAGPKQQHQKYNLSLICSILLGDFFHNLTDGVFIGTAFLLCGQSLAWTVVASTVYHEIAQEIADYFLLTHHCGLSSFWALFWNFISGFSVVIGGVIILASDLSETGIGCVLAISAGVYLYIGASECVPRIQKAQQSNLKDTFVFFIAFVSGAVPIGLVLLNHHHCESDH